ncbi:MAG: NAD(P)-dependent oxidoreductase [Alphaproteobacteria bacterium]|nr:MAG: NAD(P)-dependent oxidoreductase [Alphaproteobacteria bacterium]PZO41625.1 MAG: NAD(P)-dependent oxidoreductase [Alphaproteobacteria bacterium]
MHSPVSVIGFGEAASAVVEGWPQAGHRVRAYDRKTDHLATRKAKLADFARLNVDGFNTMAGAVTGADGILCFVTADQATVAAREGAMSLSPNALWFDMNSVAPETKRLAAHFIEAVGGRYVDVAVLSPVLPKRRAAPLLVGGPHAEQAAQHLKALGFSDVTEIDGPVGAAAAVKMIRSVMVKGIEALSAECAMAAHKANVVEAVIASLDASWPGADWGARLDYNLDRMMIHGLRRAAEMQESVATLEALGVRAGMTRATVELQQAIGSLAIEATPEGLLAKLDALTEQADRVAA